MASTPTAAKKRSAVEMTPPTVSRSRESSADENILETMVSQIGNGKWSSNGETYDARRAASNAAVVYRRSLIRKLGGDPFRKGDEVAKTIKTKVWEQSEGKYVFALARKTD